jgi:transcriptional regulator with XRE-family HTH domain
MPYTGCLDHCLPRLAGSTVVFVTRNGNDNDPRRVFGSALKHLRTRAGLSQEQLGRAAFISGDMIAKVERGDRSPSVKLVEACEQVTELGSNGMLTVLWEQLKVSRPSFPGWFAPWPDLESKAVRLKAFELYVVPGLLQTEGYARALLTGRIGFNGDVEEAVTARLARQAILERDQPPEMFAVIDEAALHRPVGSPGVMADQLGHLADVAARVIVRIIPASTGVHDGLQGAFTVADFADGSAAAYLESGLRGQVIQDSGDVSELTATWDRVAAETLPRQQA